ncbi:MAG: lysophospholipid acyltransferase family protein [Spirochaetaceae bacterium]|nr:MAG: lysophospholipid acyltransferase family protein [Spirochaetaceae bacterium]
MLESMTRARHSPWADRVFLPYILRQFRKHFHGLYFMGPIPTIDPALPLLITPNHSTWWDGFFLYILNKRLLERKLHLMMLEEQLSKYRFFSRIGAFGIEPGLPRKSYDALKYSAQVLQDPANALCIFPQGVLRYSGKRPLEFQRGVGHVLKLQGGEVNLLPLAIRCDFLLDQRAEVFFMADRVFQTNHRRFRGVAWLEQEETALLERLNQKILAGESGQILVRGREPANVRWDAFLRRLGLAKSE